MGCRRPPQSGASLECYACNARHAALEPHVCKRAATCLCPCGAGTTAAVGLLDSLGRRGVLAIGAVAGMVAEAALVVLLALPGRPGKAMQYGLAVLLALRDAKVAWYWPVWTATVTEHFPLSCRSFMLAAVLTLAYGIDALTWTVLSRVMCSLKYGNLVWMAACDAAVLVSR